MPKDNIILQPDAVAYIKEKNLPVKITVPRKISFCCGSIVPELLIEWGEPTDTESYHLYNKSKEVKLYIDKQISLEQKMELYLVSFLGFKRLKIYTPSWI